VAMKIKQHKKAIKMKMLKLKNIPNSQPFMATKIQQSFKITRSKIVKLRFIEIFDNKCHRCRWKTTYQNL
jgi:hypothetical protein